MSDPKDVASGVGVQHVVDINAIFYSPNTAPASYSTPLNAPIIPIMQGYWTSFIRSLDPNAHRANGSPEWGPWGSSGTNGQRILLMTNATRMESVPADQQKRCNYLLGLGVLLQQ